MATEWTTGCQCRVWALDRSSSQRATLALDNDDGSFDIILDVGSGGEEANVDRSRIESLQDFEVAAALDGVTDPLKLKDYGNHLFMKCKDWDAAMQFYSKALEALGRNGRGRETFSTGSSVLVSRKGSMDIRTGMISDCDKSKDSYDIMYEENPEEEEEEEEEETGVSGKRLVPLGEVRHRDIQRACFLNMARCAVKKSLHGWAIKYASFALVTTEMISGDYQPVTSFIRSGGIDIDVDDTSPVSTLWKKQIADCLFLRSKSLLAAGRPGMSNKDCKLLAGVDAVKASSLHREILAFRQQRHKSDKKLAKAMVGWVSEAMNISGTSIGADGDLVIEGVDDDGDDDDDDDDGAKESQSHEREEKKQEKASSSGWLW